MSTQNNNVIKFSLKSIVDGISESNSTALTHAAEISPLVTERTIGSDIDIEWEDVLKEKKIQKDVAKPCKTESKHLSNSLQPKSAKTPEKSINITQNVLFRTSPLQSLDADFANSTVIIRKNEIESKRKLFKHIDQLIELEKNIVSQHKSIPTGRNEWLEEKYRNEARLLEQVEIEVAKDVAAAEQRKKELHDKKQRQLQVIALNAVTAYQEKFQEHYIKLTQALQPFDMHTFPEGLEQYNHELKDLIYQYDLLTAKIKNESCGPSELKTAEKLCNSMCTLCENIKATNEKNQIALKNKKEQAQKEEQLKLEKELQQNNSISTSVVTCEPEIINNTSIIETTSVVDSVPSNFGSINFTSEAEIIKNNATIANTLEVENVPSNFGNTITTAPLESTHIDTQTHTTERTVPTSVLTSMGTPFMHNETKIPANPNSTSNFPDVLLQAVSQERFELYNKINAFYQEKLDKVKPLQSDDSLKKYRSACQKAINIPINAIAAVNPQHLRDKFEKLYNFIIGQPIKLPEGLISVNDHPLGRDYCMLLMTKKMVKQGDSQIASSTPAAFPVASVAISLWKLIPDFGTLFLAYLFKESPYLVPYYIAQQPGQSTEDYCKVLGYMFKDGAIEKQDLFLQRQAGFARLFAAIMITNGRQIDGPSQPFGLDQCWRWITNLIRLEPLPDICGTMLSEVLHIVSANLYATYGKQFLKLLIFIKQSYIPKLKDVDNGGTITRLELMLENCLVKGVFPTPAGILPQGFW